MTEPIDYAAIRKLLRSREYPWDISAPFGKNIEHLIDSCFCIPNAEIQIPLLAAYACIPSALCDKLPVLFIYGAEGCGKTELSNIYAAIHQTQVFAASSTFASIRNEIDNKRFQFFNVDGADFQQKLEKNFCLVLDNLNKETLTNEQLYTLLLTGFNRHSSNTVISVETGKNRIFSTFCPKVLSSIHGLFSEPRYRELGRRCLYISMKPIERLTEADNPNRMTRENDPGQWNLAILASQYKEFWSDRDNLSQFLVIRDSIPIKINTPISTAYLSLCLDMIAAAIVAGVWRNFDDALSCLEAYWNSRTEHTEAIPLVEVLKNFIKQQKEVSERNGKSLTSLEPYSLKQFLAFAVQQAWLDNNPSSYEIAEALKSLGFVRTRDVKGVWKWIGQ